MARRVLALLVSIIAVGQHSYGAPVYNKLMKFRQPDGQSVEVRVWGGRLLLSAPDAAPWDELRGRGEAFPGQLPPASS